MKTESSKFGGIKSIVSSIGGVQLYPSLGYSKKVARRFVERTPVRVNVPNTTSFVARDNFVIGTQQRSDRRQIRGLGANFKKYLLPKVETAEVPAEELTVYRILDELGDSEVISALGNGAEAEITLGQFFTACTCRTCVMDYSSLLEDGYACVGYVRDIDNNLKAVYGSWGHGGLFVDADEPDSVARWSARCYLIDLAQVLPLRLYTENVKSRRVSICKFVYFC